VVQEYQDQKTLTKINLVNAQQMAGVFTGHFSFIFVAMKKIYHLGNCGTCKTILSDIQAAEKGFELQDIKTEKITPAQLDELKKMAGSYEALFSRRALKYKEMGLKDKQLTEKDYRKLILQEYTFLKRPVVVNGKKIFIGSEKKTVAALKSDS